MGRYRKGEQLWSIERENLTLVIDGVIETFADVATLTMRERILINQKLRAGWKLAPVESETREDVPLRFGATNPALEDAILANPDDETAWQIYGDWLIDQHDVRGEYIVRKRIAEASPHDGMAAASLRDFTERHRAYLENGLAGTVKLGWGVPIWYRSSELGALEHSLAGAGRFVRTLDLHFETGETELTRLAERPPRSLRELLIGTHRSPAIHSLAPLFLLLPRLTVLEIRHLVDSASLGPSPLPQLRALTIHSHALAPVLGRTDLRSLRFFSTSVAFGAAEIAALCEAPFAHQLAVLALMGLEPHGVAPLIEAYRAGKLSAVETLHVPFGSGKNRDALGRVFPRVS